MAVLVPYYLMAYGPTNFLYFCDVALLFVLAAVWFEWPTLASMPALGILVPQVLWCIDFVGTAMGRPILGMTEYMFNPSISLFTRSLSLFHIWLPIFVVWLVWRLGYDRRALWRWTVLAWAIQLVCYFWMPQPPAPADNPNLPVNINYVYGLSNQAPQSWMPPVAYLAVVMLAMPALFYWPTHWLMSKYFPRVKQQ